MTTPPFTHFNKTESLGKLSRKIKTHHIILDRKIRGRAPPNIAPTRYARTSATH